MLAVQAATRSEEHKKALQEERMKDMQMHLAQQAQVNPRLKRLRAQQTEVQTSISHPSFSNSFEQKKRDVKDVILPPIPIQDSNSNSNQSFNHPLDYGKPVIPPIPTFSNYSQGYNGFNGYNGSWGMPYDPYSNNPSYFPPPQQPQQPPPIRPYPPSQGYDYYYGNYGNQYPPLPPMPPSNIPLNNAMSFPNVKHLFL